MEYPLLQQRLRKPTPRSVPRGRRVTRGRSIDRDRPRPGVDAHDPVHPDDNAPASARRARSGRSLQANLSTADLYEVAIRAGEGLIAADGPLVVRTGKHTGRSPKDKFVVREPSSQDKIWWGEVNQPISEEHYDRLRARLVDYLAERDLYAQDCFIGAHPDHRRSLRVYTETAWASIFARNLFRRPSAADLAAFAPNFTIINVPSFKADPSTEGHPQRDGDPRPPRPDGGDHRRHRVRR